MANSYLKLEVGDLFIVEHDAATADVGLYIANTKVVGAQFGTAIPNFTDNTGGTASTTAIANLADGTTYATDHPTIENNFASLTAKINLIIDALSGHGLITES